MKATLQVLLISVFFLLASCGGSGGGGGGTTTPPPPASDSPGGIWRGTLTSSVLNQVEEIVGVITEAGQARFVSLDGGQQYFGQISVEGDTASGTLRAVSLIGGQFADGSGSGNINITATITERSAIDGTFVGVGDEGTFSVVFDTLYDLDSSLAVVQRHWTAAETIFKVLVPGFGGPIGANIDASGRITAADLDGCDYSGSVSILDAQYNVYSVTLVVSSCGAWDGQYSGFGVLDNSTGPADALLIAVTTNEVSIAGLLAEAAPESASGLWSGDIQSLITGDHHTMGMISEEGDVQFFSLTGPQIAGSVEVFGGQIFRMRTVAYAPFGTTHPDGSISGSVDVRGFVRTGFNLSGGFEGVGDSGGLNAFYTTLYERTSSLSLLQGIWSTPNPTGGSGDLVISIASTGEFSGSSDGCDYSGVISIIDAIFNVYRLDADIANCAGISGQYSGLGALSDEQSLNDTLVVSVNNEITSLWAVFSRVP